MATTLLKNVALLIFAAFAHVLMVQASDPDILSDFIVPAKLLLMEISSHSPDSVEYWIPKCLLATRELKLA